MNRYVSLIILLSLCGSLGAQEKGPVFRFTLENILSAGSVDETNPYNPDNMLGIDEVADTVRLTVETEGDRDGLVHYGISGRLTADSAGDTDSDIREAWISLGRDFSSMIKIGRQKAAWGKGYVWSPADYINRPKNALDADDPVQGRTMVLGEVPFRNGSFSAVVIPDPEDDTPFGTEFENVFSAVRFSCLIRDTDLALAGGLGPEGEKKAGFSLSQPAGTVIITLEASWSTCPGRKYYSFTSDPLSGPYYTEEGDEYKLSGILGFNVQTAAGNGFLSGELYYDESGWDEDEMDAYCRLYALAAGDPVLYGKLYGELTEQYVPARMGRLYGYLSYSHTIRDFHTLACSAVYAAQDSFVYMIPSYTYTGIADTDIRAEVLVPAGNTDDGEGSLFMTHSVFSLWLTVYF